MKNLPYPKLLPKMELFIRREKSKCRKRGPIFWDLTVLHAAEEEAEGITGLMVAEEDKKKKKKKKNTKKISNLKKKKKKVKNFCEKFFENKKIIIQI